MKKVIIVVSQCVAMILLASGAFAQKVELGVKGGLNIPNLTSGGKDTPVSEDYSSIQSAGGGVFVEFCFTKTFSLQTGLEYSRQGGKKDGVQALPAAPIYAGAAAENPAFSQMSSFMPNDYLYADFKSEAQFDYLMLPVQAKFGWNFTSTSPFRVYVGAGVFGSYLMSAKRVSTGKSAFYADERRTSLANYASTTHGAIINAMPEIQQQMLLGGITAFGNSVNDLNRTQTITDDIRRGNFGLIGSIGISWKISDRHKIFLEGGGNYGLAQVQKDEINGQNRIGAASVMLGYSLAL